MYENRRCFFLVLDQFLASLGLVRRFSFLMCKLEARFQGPQNGVARSVEAVPGGVNTGSGDLEVFSIRDVK